jgi:ABC-type phosphate transport system substrate-binding protein
MSRFHLLAASCAAALCVAAPGHAQNYIQGGGAQSAQFDYFKELGLYNSTVNPATAATFHNANGDNANDTLYWPSASGTGQSSFLKNENGCNYAKVVSNSTTCSPTTVGGAYAVHYAASDATLTTTQISSWSTLAAGAAAAGHLIQIPSLGTAMSIPVVNSKVTKNGATAAHKAVVGGTVLTDADLCGIFSGKITNWNATSAGSLALKTKATVADGLITVVYRSDSAAATALLLTHLSAVCTATNSNFTLPIVPGNTFVNVFPGGVPPIPAGSTTTNFLGVSGSGNVAATLNNATGGSGPVLTSAIGYLSPDWTSVDPNSDDLLPNGSKSTLVVAALKNGSLPYIPLVADITNALNHVKAGYGQFLTPPTTAAAGANPQNWGPVVEVTTVGYPIVGYTTFDFAQCYANPLITAGILSFLTQHYNATSAYAPIIARNGLVAIGSSGAKAFAATISQAILTNVKKWNVNIGNATACKGLAGR